MAGNEFQIRVSKASPKKISNQMSTLITLFRFMAMKGKLQTKTKERKTMNPLTQFKKI